MALGKWIGACIGAFSGGTLGMIAGYVIGSIFDKAASLCSNTSYYREEDEDTTNSRNEQSSFSPQGRHEQTQEEERNGFLFCLLVLSAHIIKADGKVMHSEMETVRNFLRTNFGEVAVEQGGIFLLRLFEYRELQGEGFWSFQLQEACKEIRDTMPPEHRLQLLVFLAEIVKADGNVAPAEITELRKVASLLGFHNNIIDQFLSLGGNSIDDAYKVLGVSPSATDDEVRRAYRTLVKQNHPDRVATLGDDVKKAAQKKMQEINDAKERIFKERGL